MELKIMAGGVAEKKHRYNHCRSGCCRAEERDPPGVLRAFRRNSLAGSFYGRRLNERTFSHWINVKIYAVENTELRTSCPTMARAMSDKLSTPNKFAQNPGI
jgi:hypothetical protein